MYAGEYDACDVTLSAYPHLESLKNMPGHGGKTCLVTVGHQYVNTARTPYIFSILCILMFCRNHLKNTSCDVGFLNKYYYHSFIHSVIEFGSCIRYREL
jgi:hypothetical protein